jgi:hypothetical protein
LISFEGGAGFIDTVINPEQLNEYAASSDGIQVYAAKVETCGYITIE